MQEFFPGQRWISSTELQMGLGTVMVTDFRSVTIVFLATGETRIYAKETAPLTRVSFGAGDTVISHEDWGMTITSVSEENNLFVYYGIREDGEETSLNEGDLNNFIQLNRPADRLFSGLIDKNKWYELRYQTLLHLNRLSHSDLRGLTGGRTSLIPHQLYIAHEVANRFAPRVLLADEVGLGKTIEAGLILHHQLLTGRANRVLILVPETLQHQWLVEMLRRFNLHFSIFNEARCQAADESSGQDNPFQTEQLILCSLEFLVKQANRFQQVLESPWDLLVVDEAHHLQWSKQHKSTEYEIVESLSAVTSGVLLLTATPEQLGKDSHFARLRLLDPDRFPDFDTFIAEEKTYEPVAEAIQELLDGSSISKSAGKTLTDTLEEGDNADLLDVVLNSDADSGQSTQAREALVEHLLDRHGTGRVLLRNTRSAVKGFPGREVIPAPLILPEIYADCYAAADISSETSLQTLLSPELLYRQNTASKQDWTEIDPRVDWLFNTLKTLKPEKVLVITANAQTALDLSDVLRTRHGIHAAVFFEGLSIIDRDRAAAYFADKEYGSQVLVCSEIGSEGRNFQFAHHLVLFDLPFNPDLLEQRIGRLDRIGQTQTIKIHVPWFENSAQAIMYRWYHEGLDSFRHTCPAGHNVFVQTLDMLTEALQQADNKTSLTESLIQKTSQLHQDLNEELQRGRDRLLEYNSCRPAIANALREKAIASDETSTLADYMENIFDCHGIDIEVHADNSFIIRPGDHMQEGNFPGLDGEGMTITYDRETALIYEDMRYITWEHPLVTGAMEMVMLDEQGNTAVIAIKNRKFTPGKLFLETIFTIESSPSETLQTARYLPPTTLRIVIDEKGADIADTLSHAAINKTLIAVNKETANKVIRAHNHSIRDLILRCEEQAHQRAPGILAEAHKQTLQTLQKETDRLIALQKVNPNVRQEEIQFFQSQTSAMKMALDTSAPRLDAVRIIVST